MPLALFPLAEVLLPIGKDIIASSVHLIIEPVALVKTAILPEHGSFAMTCVVLPIAIVDATIVWSGHLALSMSDIILVLTFICMAISPLLLAFAIALALKLLPVISVSIWPLQLHSDLLRLVLSCAHQNFDDFSLVINLSKSTRFLHLSIDTF